MAQSRLSIEEGPPSPDIFSDPEQTVDSISSPNLDESYPCTSRNNEPELIDNTPEWKGLSMDEIYKGLGPFGYQQHPLITPSESHTVLFRLPLNNRGPPKPYPTHPVDKWTVNYVRMPHSSHSLYPIEKDDKPRELRLRWEIIQEALLQNFISVAQLEAGILSYNDKYAQRWDFSALHHFFSEVMDEEETAIFFENLLPKIIQLALQLPTLITGAIPLLRRHVNSMISLSQLQVASLIANAFFCTFPRRNSTNPQSEYAMYPYINFNKLFSAYKEERPNRSAAVIEKLKCLFHYFRRVTAAAPEGTITIQRRYIPRENCPRWDKISEQLLPLHITSKGTIETEGAGLLQVDFANKYIGGGVLNWGCVQEEIRFVICPELMVTMLVSEVLDDTEALIVTGVERYSQYEGYSNSFKWTGDFIDETPRDNSGRRRTSIVAIDALHFAQADAQFNTKNIIRELNKAYVGFSSSEMHHDDLSAIATGNWGCGAFRGNPKLKVLIQLMAAAVAKRPMVYFTFGDVSLRDSVAEMYWHLVDRNVEIGTLFSLLRQYEVESTTNHSDFYRFLFNRSKIKPLTKYFSVLKKKLNSEVNGKPEKKTNDEQITQSTFIKKTKSSPWDPTYVKQFAKDQKIKAQEKPFDQQNTMISDNIPSEKENKKMENIIDNDESNGNIIDDKIKTPRKTELMTVKKKNVSLFELFGEQQSTTKKIQEKSPEIQKPTVVVDDVKSQKKEKLSLWDVFAEKESVKDRIQNKSPEKRYPSLDFLVSNSKNITGGSTAVNSSKLENDSIPDCQITVIKEKKSSMNRPNVQKRGQRKILDFFSLKNT